MHKRNKRPNSVKTGTVFVRGAFIFQPNLMIFFLMFHLKFSMRSIQQILYCSSNFYEGTNTQNVQFYVKSNVYGFLLHTVNEIPTYICQTDLTYLLQFFALCECSLHSSTPDLLFWCRLEIQHGCQGQ